MGILTYFFTHCKPGRTVFTLDLTTGIFALPNGDFSVFDLKRKAEDIGHTVPSGLHSIDANKTAQIVAFSGTDDVIYVVDRKAQTTLVTHRGHIGAARRVVLRADARKLASAGDDGTVRIWSVPDPTEPKPYSGHHEHNVTAVAFSQDGTLLAAGDYLGSIAVWSSQTGTRELKLGSHYLRRKSQPVALEIGTGKPFVEGKTPKKHYTHFVASATVRDPIVDCYTSEGHGGAVKGVAFTPNKKTLVSAGAKDLIIWDLKSGKLLKQFEHPALVSSLAVSGEGTLAATGCWDNIVRIFDVPSGEIVKELEGHDGNVMSVDFHPTRYELATGSRDHTVIVWDLGTGKIKYRIRPHKNTVSVVRFTPDGKRLVTGGMDKAIYVWTAETGRYESTLHGHNEGVTSLALSADGKSLVSASDGSDDTAARVWLWNGSRFREGAIMLTDSGKGPKGKGPTALAVHPVTGDLLLGRYQLAAFDTKPFVEAPVSAAERIGPEVLRAKELTDDRLKILGYALVDAIGTWPDAEKGRVLPGQRGGQFLVIATSLPFRRLKLSDADYKRLHDLTRKDPDASEPLRFGSMLIYPQRFLLAEGPGKPSPADFVGRMGTSQQEGFEFMKKGVSMLENMTATPHLDHRELVYVGWEVDRRFFANNLRLRFDNDDPVPVPAFELEMFRPGIPFHPASRTFGAAEGGNRLRSQVTRFPGP